MRKKKYSLRKELNDTRDDLKARAEQGDKEAAMRLAALRNVDKLYKRLLRAKKAYQLAKQQLS